MKRPIIFFTLFLCLGIISAYYFTSITSFVLMFIGVFLFNLLLYFKFNDKVTILFILFFILGVFITSNVYKVNSDKKLNIEGVVINKEEHNGFDNLVIKTKYINDEKENIKILLITRDKKINTSDYIKFESKFTEIESKKSQNIFYSTYCDDVYVVQSLKNLNYYRNIFLSKISKVYDDILPEDESNIVKALVLGQRDELDKNIKDLYKIGGIFHILALSGVHIAIISGFLLLILKYFIKGNAKNIIVILFLIFYLFLTGASVSTTRAVVMVCCVLVAPFFRRENDLISSICISAFIILLIFPYSLFSVSFVLTYSAVLSIVLLSPRVEYYFSILAVKSKNESLIKFALNDIKFLSPFISSFLVLTIILAYYFYYIYPYVIFVNIIVSILVAPLIVLSILCGVVGLFSMGVATLIGNVVYYILICFEFICYKVSELPYSSVLVGKPTIITLIFYFLMLYILFFDGKNKIKKLVVVISMLISVNVFYNNITEVSLIKDKAETVFINDNGLVLVDCDTQKFYENEKYILSKGVNKVTSIVTNSVDNTLYFYDKDMILNVYICNGNELIEKLEKNKIPYILVEENTFFEVNNNKFLIDVNNLYFENEKISFASVYDNNNVYKTNVLNKVQNIMGYYIIVNEKDKLKEIQSNTK